MEISIPIGLLKEHKEAVLYVHKAPSHIFQIVNFFFTSLTAHIRATEPMLLVIVTKVALARSSLLTDSRFSL